MKRAVKHALIVDDDASSLRAYERILVKHGVEVHAASSPSEALGLVSMLDQQPHAIVAFVDVLMPGMDGPRFVHALRCLPAFGPRGPVVLVSALSGPALEKATIEWGASGFIQKARGLLHVDQEFAGWLERV